MIARQKLDGTGHEVFLSEDVDNCEGMAIDWLGNQNFTIINFIIIALDHKEVLSSILGLGFQEWIQLQQVRRLYIVEI